MVVLRTRKSSISTSTSNCITTRCSTEYQRRMTPTIEARSSNITSPIDGTPISVFINGPGSREKTVIPDGKPYAGRRVGGGTRDSIYGTSLYGSGYPDDVFQPGVSGRGFPYAFFPVVWPRILNTTLPGYVFSEEYGDVDNPNRPGGPLFQFSVSSNSTSTYHIVTDQLSAECLFRTINSTCLTKSDSSSEVNITRPVQFAAIVGFYAEPQQAVQYYRASSVVLTLDGYNNTSMYGGPPYKPATFPTNSNLALLRCINTTIGNNVLLTGVGSSTASWQSIVMGISIFLVVAFIYFGPYDCTCLDDCCSFLFSQKDGRKASYSECATQG